MWHRSFLSCVNEARKRGLCLYGAGFWGDMAFRLFSLFGVIPVCYCDDDDLKIGKLLNGIIILTLQDAAVQFPNAVYIVCVDQTETWGLWGRVHQKKMIDNLKSYNLYDRNSELRLAFYVYLADINGTEGIQCSKRNLCNYNTDEMFWWNDLRNLAIVNNMSNSGVWFFAQLLDMHSHILCLPYCKTLENIYINRLQYLEGDELVIEMAAQALGYFKSAYENLKCIGQHKFENYCIDKKGDVLREAYIEPVAFLSNLYMQFRDGEIKLQSYGQMLKIYFAAYNNCLNRKCFHDINYWMVYDMHTPAYDVSSEYENLAENEFDRIENFILVREPVQHCYSWVNRAIVHAGNNVAAQKWFIADIIKSELGKNLERKKGYDNLHVISVC